MVTYWVEADVVVLAGEATSRGGLLNIEITSLNGEVLADLGQSRRNVLED